MPRSVSDPAVGFGVKGRRLLGLLALFSLFVLSGCASFSEGFAKVEQETANRNVPGAIAALDGLRLSGADKSLNHLNKGMLYRLQGDYVKSNLELDAAKRILDEVGAVSVTEQALSVAANDTMKAYEGDGNEQLLIYAVKALNYLQMDDLDAAAVEARQFDIKHRLVVEKNPDAKHQSASFVRYLNGMIYEMVGERDSARIEYSKAIEGYKAESGITGVPPPKSLLTDYARVAGGRTKVAKRAAPAVVVAPPPVEAPVAEAPAKGKKGSKGATRRTAPAAPPPVAAPAPIAVAEPSAGEPELEVASSEPAAPAGTGEVVFLLHNGLGPSLTENILQVPNPNPGTGAAVLRLALPKFVGRPVPVARVDVAAGGATASTETVANINALAKRSLEDRLPVIQARAVARLVAKNVAAAAVKKEADKKGDSLGGALLKLTADVAAIASERADTRTWAMLPGNIQMARLNLPAGKQTLQATYYGHQGGTLATRQYPVDVRPGKKTFVYDYYVVAVSPAAVK
jgi:hypothetical protein